MKRLYILLSSVLLMNICVVQASSKKRPARSESVEAMARAVAAGAPMAESVLEAELGAIDEFGNPTVLDALLEDGVFELDESGLEASLDGSDLDEAIGGAAGSNIDQLYVCDYEGCGQAFKQRSYLKKHKRIHTGEKPYACDHPGCGQSFTDSSNLNVHKRTHTGKRPYVCDHSGCGKDFKQKAHLTSHMLTHTGEKSHVCDNPGCGKAFGRRGHLNSHKKICKVQLGGAAAAGAPRENQVVEGGGEDPEDGTGGAGEVAQSAPKRSKMAAAVAVGVAANKIGLIYVCDYEGCDKVFYRSDLLTIHMRTHTGEKPYECDHEGCGKAFSRSGTLADHKLIHTGERPFVCDYVGCGKSFSKKGNLTRHKKSCKARLGGAAAAGAGAPSEDPVVEEGFEDPTTLDTFLNDGEVELDESDAEMPEMDEVFKDPKDGTGD